MLEPGSHDNCRLCHYLIDELGVARAIRHVLVRHRGEALGFMDRRGHQQASALSAVHSNFNFYATELAFILDMREESTRTDFHCAVGDLQGPERKAMRSN